MCKHRVLLPLLLSLSTIGSVATASGVAEATMDDLVFMAGAWVGTQGQTETEELWTAPKAGIMLGVHRDVMASGRAAFEYLRIERDADGIVYQASPQGREATPFRLVEIGRDRAVFANPQHDFPQRIAYWLEDGRLRVRVEGEAAGQRRALEWSWEPAPLVPGSSLPTVEERPRGQRAIR